MNHKTKIEVKDGRWTVKGALIDLFINSKREFAPTPARVKISKEHNHKFNFKNK